MKTRLKVVLLSAAVSVLGAGAALAQQGAVDGAPIFGAPPAGATNLTGKWINATPEAALMTEQKKAPPLNAKGKVEYAKHMANPKSDPNLLCQLQGEPRLLFTAYPFLILHYQDHIDFVHEVNHTFRIVPFGQPLDPESDPLWLGHASAKLDGKAVVIDGINYNDKTWLDYKGLPHGNKLKTQERYTLSDDGRTISGTVSIDDPEYYSRPWTATFTLKKLPGSTLAQYSCAADHKM